VTGEQIGVNDRILYDMDEMEAREISASHHRTLRVPSISSIHLILSPWPARTAVLTGEDNVTILRRSFRTVLTSPTYPTVTPSPSSRLAESWSRSSTLWRPYRRERPVSVSKVSYLPASSRPCGNLTERGRDPVHQHQTES